MCGAVASAVAVAIVVAVVVAVVVVVAIVVVVVMQNCPGRFCLVAFPFTFLPRFYFPFFNSCIDLFNFLQE